MDQNYFSLIRKKALSLSAFLRTCYFKMLGLSVGRRTLLGKITCDWPKNVVIGADCTLQDGIDFGISHPFSPDNYIKIGNKVFIGRYCEFNATTKIVVGDNTLIASNTKIVDVGHNIDRASLINAQEPVSGEITIGEDVWIGTGSIILKGVVIGRGSVIAAGSLVNKSIPEYQIWAGVPAKFLKERV